MTHKGRTRKQFIYILLGSIQPSLDTREEFMVLISCKCPRRRNWSFHWRLLVENFGKYCPGTLELFPQLTNFFKKFHFFIFFHCRTNCRTLQNTWPERCLSHYNPLKTISVQWDHCAQCLPLHSELIQKPSERAWSHKDEWWLRMKHDIHLTHRHAHTHTAVAMERCKDVPCWKEKRGKAVAMETENPVLVLALRSGK